MTAVVNVNVGHQSRQLLWPDKIVDAHGATRYNPTREEAAAVGWHEIAEEIPAPVGMVATAWAYEIIYREESYQESETLANPDYVLPQGEEFLADGSSNPDYIPEVGDPQITITHDRVRQVDTLTCRETATAWYDPVAEEEARKQARIAAFMANAKLVTLAHLYRATLRDNFGPNAETNHDITKESAANYFIGLKASKVITAQQLADARFLELAFDQLTQAWGPDSQGLLSTWELPWELIP